MTGNRLDSEVLATAQDAINLPEVQEMMKRLAAYNLGVFMPHMHDAEGSFAPLPEGMVQVEDDLQVSFQPAEQSGPENLPVGWRWSERMHCATPIIECKLEKKANGEWEHTKVYIRTVH